MLRDHVGFMDTPLATKDIDHPMKKKFKNVAEGMMLGPVVDGVFDIAGTGAKYVTKGVDPKTGKTVYLKRWLTQLLQITLKFI